MYSVRRSLKMKYEKKTGIYTLPGVQGENGGENGNDGKGDLQKF